MPERDSFSPSGQDSYKPNWREAYMLRRISRMALWLPEDFDTPGRGGKVHVTGHASPKQAVIMLKEKSQTENNGRSKNTNVALTRDQSRSDMFSGLEADRMITNSSDSTRSAIQSATGEHQVFSLGDEGNTLSLFQVMRSVSLAAHMVADAETINFYRNHPEHNDLREKTFNQTF